MNCKICSHKSEVIFEAVLLKKYTVKYYRCPHCFFIQTEEPYWLNEAYNDAIGQLDVGLVTRNLSLAETITPILYEYFNVNKEFLDYGGGYGLFVRLMRDNGINFYRQDTYCENIFAQHFDIEDLPSGTSFELLTAIELFEHLPNPIEQIEKMFEYSPNIFFTTQLQEKKMYSGVDDWWYFSPEAGQHVSLYSYESLVKIAEIFNKKIYSNGSNLHLLTNLKLPSSVLKTTLFNRLKRKMTFKKKNSLLMGDYRMIKEFIS